MADILVILPTSLRGIVQSSGALHDVRQHHKADRLTILTSARYRETLQRCPWADQVWDDAPLWKFHRVPVLRARLRTTAWERVYDLRNSRRSAFYFRHFLKGVAWSGTVPGCSLFYSHPEPQTLTVIAQLAGQLGTAGVPIAHALTPDMTWLAEEGAIQLPKDAIVLLPGSSKASREQRWPYYADLASRLLAHDFNVVTVPGPDEMDLAKTMPGQVLTNGGKPLSLPQLASVLRQASFVVGNDSGPTYLAAFDGIPGVALFGEYGAGRQTGLQRRGFDVIEINQLTDLSADMVARHVLNRLGVMTDLPEDATPET